MIQSQTQFQINLKISITNFIKNVTAVFIISHNRILQRISTEILTHINNPTYTH